MASAARQAPRLLTACDRCYRVKERCTRQAISDTCGRCDRLGYPCQTIRPPRRAGRRPTEPQHTPEQLEVRNSTSSGLTPVTSLHSTDAAPPPFDIGTWINNLTELDQDEREKLLFLLDQPENLDFYVVSPGFRDVERQSLAAPLPAALPVLKDAYLACAGALKNAMRLHQHCTAKIDDEHANLLHALAAMKTLRTLSVSTPQDAALCLTLGASLTLYVYSAVGHGIYEISQHCLSVVRPFVEMEMLDSDAESWLKFLTVLEITECLVHRRRPTIRIPWRQSLGSRRNVVDRRLGLCTPLLPYYHDLCVISHSLANTTDASYMALVEKQLGQLHAEMEVWQPSQPDHFVEQFKSAEVLHLLAQARLYRLAALLVSHRLRYKFDERDDQADIWANEIMSELELVRQITKRSTHCVTMPFVVAAIEMRDPAARSKALKNADVYVDQCTPVVQKTTKIFLSRVWWERDYKLTTSWFDSTHKPCVVLASIDTALFGG